jgi:hypothetical protein
MVPEAVLKVVKVIYKALRPWLEEEAKKTATPVDNYMLELLDYFLRD